MAKQEYKLEGSTRRKEKNQFKVCINMRLKGQMDFLNIRNSVGFVSQSIEIHEYDKFIKKRNQKFIQTIIDHKLQERINKTKVNRAWRQKQE